ncbi:Uncharacterized protein DBV15_01088 [Temnothorax longispinosus]|uniref:Uncharacterized protein n=1 Tax=Temnothorax longispinosus TaxID=300112 RepID=A0A4S2JC31_9HYME|nr:Uncharacterized protein DBV15_01088 [Temnothorax longispinosus]
MFRDARRDVLVAKSQSSMAHEWNPAVNKENRIGARERCIRGFKEAGNGGNHRVTSYPSRRNNYEIAPLTLDMMQAPCLSTRKDNEEGGEIGTGKENRGENGLNASLRVSFGLLPRVDVGRTIRRDFNSEQ